MGIALFGMASIYNGIQKFMNASAHLQVQNNSTKAVPIRSAIHQQRTLRVLRVSENGESPQGAGRMVISGRMADVCAELDRLVALEAKNKPSLPH